MPQRPIRVPRAAITIAIALLLAVLTGTGVIEITDDGQAPAPQPTPTATATVGADSYGTGTGPRSVATPAPSVIPIGETNLATPADINGAPAPLTLTPPAAPAPVGDCRLVLNTVNFSARTMKVRNIAANPRVSLNFQANAEGEDVVILTGEAVVDPSAPPSNLHEAYRAKYAQATQHINYTPESLAAEFSAAIRVTPTRVRGF